MAGNLGEEEVLVSLQGEPHSVEGDPRLRRQAEQDVCDGLEVQPKFEEEKGDVIDVNPLAVGSEYLTYS